MLIWICWISILIVLSISLSSYFILGVVITFIWDFIDMKNIKRKYDLKIEKLEKDIKILKGTKANG